MGRSLIELAALVADTNLDPFDRMCHAASLTNQAHASTAELARTCAQRGEESLEDLGRVLAMSPDDVGRLIGWELPTNWPGGPPLGALSLAFGGFD